MKKLLLSVTVLCFILCSCSSPSNDVNDQTTPSDTTTVALVTTVTEDTSITETTAPEPFESSVYDVLAEYFSHYMPYGYSAVVVTSAYDLLDVYRYIMSDDARRWTSMHEEIVEGSAYNDYLNNTYTPDFFGAYGKNHDNYLIAVMIKSNNASDRYSITATADGNAINVNVELTQPYPLPRDDGGLFIYLVPMEGVYQGQELIIN